MMEIPYTTTERPDTGFTNGQLGMYLFLASEVMFFGGLFSAYAFLRTAAPVWPPVALPYAPAYAWLMTTALVLAYLAVFAAAQSQRRTLPGPTRLLQVSSIVFCVGFVALLAAQYRGLLGSGLAPAANTYIALFFVLTGIHALHVAALAVVQVAFVAAGGAMARRNPELYRGRLDRLTVFALFLVVIWLVKTILFHWV